MSLTGVTFSLAMYSLVIARIVDGGGEGKRRINEGLGIVVRRSRDVFLRIAPTWDVPLREGKPERA